MVKCLTLDFGSGHDLRVHEFECHDGHCVDSLEPAWDSPSLSLSASPSPSENKYINFKKRKKKGLYRVWVLRVLEAQLFLT